jgi:pimeloyl-ACP methyl ester carboxylesterase
MNYAAAVNFVLVHGSWHGGWCWKRVVPFLLLAKHAVHTPTLTGLGDKAHVASPDHDLNTHIEDIRAYIELHDLDDVVLVGHSYAGMVISGVVDRIPNRIRRLVYLDAFVPKNGQCAADLVSAERLMALEQQRVAGDWRTPPMPLDQLGVLLPADRAWVEPRLTPNPNRTAYSPLKLTSDALDRVAKSYILCRENSGGFARFATQARDAGWDYHEIDAGHDAMITKPKATADILLAIAALAS